MHIQNFEEDIHALILERGWAYYDSGAVKALTENPEGWTAEVTGSEEEMYRILIHGNTEIEDWHCECPYDHGPICKHVVAVLYAIKDETTPDHSGDMDQLIEKVEGEALKKFLKDRMLNSPDLMNEFMDYFDEEE